MTAPAPQPESARSISDLIEILECAYGFDSDDCELCDCPEWNALKSRVEDLTKLVRLAYNEGFTEGMKEHTHFNGGKPWEQSGARKRLETPSVSSQERQT